MWLSLFRFPWCFSIFWSLLPGALIWKVSCKADLCGLYCKLYGLLFVIVALGSFISQEQIEQIETNISPSLSGCGYKLTGYKPYGWMSEERWLQDMMHYTSEENAKALLEQQNRRDDLVSQRALIEGLDESLFEKLTVVEATYPYVPRGFKAIAVVVPYR